MSRVKKKLVQIIAIVFVVVWWYYRVELVIKDNNIINKGSIYYLVSTWLI